MHIEIQSSSLVKSNKDFSAVNIELFKSFKAANITNKPTIEQRTFHQKQNIEQ